MSAIEEFRKLKEEFMQDFILWGNLIDEYQRGGREYKVKATDNQSNVVDEKLEATTQNLNAIKADFQGSGKAHILGLINTMGQIDITDVEE